MFTVKLTAVKKSVYDDFQNIWDVTVFSGRTMFDFPRCSCQNKALKQLRSNNFTFARLNQFLFRTLIPVVYIFTGIICIWDIRRRWDLPNVVVCLLTFYVACFPTRICLWSNHRYVKQWRDMVSRWGSCRFYMPKMQILTSTYTPYEATRRRTATQFTMYSSRFIPSARPSDESVQTHHLHFKTG